LVRARCELSTAEYGHHHTQSGTFGRRSYLEVLHRSKAIRNTLQLPYRSLESVRELLNKSGDGDHILVAVIGGEVVGLIGLHTSSKPRVNHRAEIGMLVRDDWQGKGVGTAMMQAVIDLADRWLNLTRIELTVFTDNESAIALYRKFGFEIEGTLRKYAFRDGEFVDAHAMARVK
jgi:L-phenylalanine/L-methionine N-acetyltransferase